MKENVYKSLVAVRAYFYCFHYHSQGCSDGEYNRHCVIALRRHMRF